jgi:manganese oxidase
MNAVIRWCGLGLVCSVEVLLAGCAALQHKAAQTLSPNDCIFAEVVALEQPIVVNRFGAFMPGGMMYALKRDVVRIDDNQPITELSEADWSQLAGRVKLRDSKRPRPLVLRVNEKQCIDVRLHNLMTPDVMASKETDVRKIPAYRRGRPLWDHDVYGPSHMVEADLHPFPLPDGTTGREQVKIPNDKLEAPRTRAVSFHVTGLSFAPIRENECPVATENHPWVCGADTYIGLGEVRDSSGNMSPLAIVNKNTDAGLTKRLQQQGTLIKPGESAIYRYVAEREGTFFAHSLGAPVGGEGDGGQLGQGLFAAINVQPMGSTWYRSQVTHNELMLARAGAPVTALHPGQGINYENARYPANYPDASLRGRRVLAMLDKKEIVHSDLNAIVVPSPKQQEGGDTVGGKKCAEYHVGNSCGKAYREFTVIMHDEVDIVQAFAELKDPANPLHYIKDGMGINYGVGGMGAMVVAAKRGVGPAKNCPECRAEEFFLSSWANGDPALVLKWSQDGKRPVGARYPDDPSNVHHSYLNDPVRFRNIHAGPKETHVFHLHAHQWVYDESAPGSTYLDSQTIAPGATFNYEIAFGGSGNRNLSPGDSIFHCHLYPHFAQGMWELWRTHDVFEQGSSTYNAHQTLEMLRRLPDAEVAEGTEIPAIVPIPGIALAPMPTQEFAGYPFYVAGEPGHRPPQPPMDFDKLKGESNQTAAGDEYADGGLPRHVLIDKDKDFGTTNTTNKAETLKWEGKQLIRLVNQEVIDEALSKGGVPAQINAAKVYARNPQALTLLAENWKELGAVKQLAYEGEPKERLAMDFHAGKLTVPGFVTVTTAIDSRQGWNQNPVGYKTEFANVLQGSTSTSGVPTFFVNGRDPKPGAPFADPCPPTYDSSNPSSANTTDAVARVPLRTYKSAFIQTELTVNRHGWFDPQARIIALEQDVKDIVNPNTRVSQPEPLFFRANSGDCIVFKSSNFVPNALALDDFQIYTPTDTIGQHIHLVKFDVTSSDGSGNGWNYEDGTYSPDEVRERVFAYNRWAHSKPGKQLWTLKTHPLFGGGKPEESCKFKTGDAAEEARCTELMAKGQCPGREEQMAWPWGNEEAMKKHAHHLATTAPLCGAQRTVQRWWADPILDTSNRAKGKKGENYKPELGQDKDFTLRTVFTHDHFGPSSHQQHGLYAALVVEPANSVWLNLQSSSIASWTGTQALPYADVSSAALGGADLSGPVGPKELRAPMQLRNDGGPTSPRATIVAPECVNDLGSNRLGSKGLVQCQDNQDGSKQANQTRREFGVAFADFAIVYNTALEPINPENRDLSALYLGQRQVPYNMPKPLAISSEDPGTQLINYRNEPIPLRITDFPPKATPKIGGFNFSLQRDCLNSGTQCTGDMANVFSTPAHKQRDNSIADAKYPSSFSGFYEALLNKRAGPANKRIGVFANNPVNASITGVINHIEDWRKDFHCALYPQTELPSSLRSYCNTRKHPIINHEPWREMGDPATPILAAYEGDSVQIRLIQGAQEAQHVFAMNGGVRWLKQPNVPNSGYVAAQPLGISEHFEFDIQLSAQRKEWDRVDRMYYGSSMDQLWDGMWGVLRSFDAQTMPSPGQANKYGLRFGPLNVGHSRVDEEAPTALPAICARTQSGVSPRIATMAVSAVTVSQLYASCRSTDVGFEAQKMGLILNQRIKMHDPDAVVYLPTPLHSSGRSDISLAALQQRACQMPEALQPTVFRAAAGDCIQVQLMNHVPRRPRDGHESVARHGYNLMSMIVDGMNFNQMEMSGSVGLSAPLVAQDPIYADGSNVGINGQDKFDVGQGSLAGAASVAPLPYAWYAGDYQLDDKGYRKDAPIELGVLALRSFGDVIKHPAHSLVGALVIGPQGSQECTPAQEDALVKKRDLVQAEVDADRKQGVSGGTSKSICNAAGDLLYRDFVLVLQDAIDAKREHSPVANLKGAEEPDDYGVKGINFRSEPLWSRQGGSPSLDFNVRNESDYAHVFSSKRLGAGCQSGTAPQLNASCDPETPVFVAKAGTEVRFRVVHPGGHTRQQAIAIAGHRWSNAPYTDGSTKMHAKSEDAFNNAWTVEGNAHAIGPMMSANLLTRAGGTFAQPGDYLIRSQSNFQLDGGIWGLFRVVEGAGKVTSTFPLIKE